MIRRWIQARRERADQERKDRIECDKVQLRSLWGAIEKLETRIGLLQASLAQVEQSPDDLRLVATVAANKPLERQRQQIEHLTETVQKLAERVCRLEKP